MPKECRGALRQTGWALLRRLSRWCHTTELYANSFELIEVVPQMNETLIEAQIVVWFMHKIAP
jgi:hypothetical protein